MSEKDQQLLGHEDALNSYVESMLGVSSLKNEKKSSEKPPQQKQLQAKPSPQQASSQAAQYIDSEDAPAFDLTQVLPHIPSMEEIEALDLAQKNEEILKRLNEKEQENKQLKSELDVSIKTIEQLRQEQRVEYSPDWANPYFQVMLFSVAGLKLALPISSIDNIIIWDDKYLTKMPGSPDWHLGLVKHLGQNIPVADTMQQVVPQEKFVKIKDKRPAFSNIIIINEHDWGLACDKVIGIEELKAEDVKWRSTRTKRRWLYGTIKEHMCALLDAAEFAAMLHTGKDSIIS